MTTRLKSLSDWVAQVAELTSPDRIHWCEGTEQEYRKLIEEMLDSGSLLELNQQHYPGCYLHRSDPEDVARVEHLTFVCTHDKDDAGPNNNWLAPAEAKAQMTELFRRLHARPDDVRDSLLHGPDRLSLRALRRRDHR